MNKIHEECGVFGVYAKEKTSVASTAYYGLFALQHRGHIIRTAVWSMMCLPRQ